MKIESITIRNYKVFKNVSIGNLPNMAVFVGANGSGKTTLFDVFGFLHDALLHNVKSALTKRGGFKEVVSRGQEGPIEFEIKFRPPDMPKVTYTLAVGQKDGEIVVEREILKYRRGQHGKPWHFLDFTKGKGSAIANEDAYLKENAKEQRVDQELESKDILAIKGLGQFQRFKAVSIFRKMIEDWHVSDFHIAEARSLPEAAYAEHLSQRGENLALVAQYVYENYRKVFDNVLKKMSERVPGIADVNAAQTEDGRIVLKFKEGSFKDPFVAKYVSDGTIKMFAYLLLLYDPKPHPLLCVEEPENQLYPHLLTELAEEFRDYARRGGQVFISTHSPEFLDSVNLDEVFLLYKNEGYTEIRRAAENEVLKNLVREGDSLGTLWNQGLLNDNNLL